MSEPGQTAVPVADAQNMPWPRDSYTNRAGGEESGILQIRVSLP
jgi:hypothetical protein